LDATLYALEAKAGTLFWSCTTENRISSSPAVVDGVVYAGSQDHSLYACDATTDEKLWSHTTGDSIISSPMGAQGFVYVGSNDHNLYAFNQIYISPRENSQNS
jgi:outer membrane protein assembly factor BamB